MKPATIYDVARLAGVSHQTVTRYLRGSEGVRPDTGRRVEVALRQLDYRPNSAARLLRSRQTNRIGVLADRIDANGPVRILNAMSVAAHARGYVLDVVVADGTSSGSVLSSLEVLRDHQVAGIVATANTDVVREELSKQQLGVPLVLGSALGVPSGDPSPSEVAGMVAADHLLALGHRRVGYVAGPEQWLASQGRAQGFGRRFAEGGGRVVWRRFGDWTPTSGYQAWAELDDTERSVTAVAVGNDSMAVGVLAAAIDTGYDVPARLSVIGTDDVAEARYQRPSLTTVAMDFEREGQDLMEVLIARIEGNDVAVPHELPAPVLMTRGSTGPAAALPSASSGRVDGQRESLSMR